METTATVNWNKGTVAQAHIERDEELCQHESHIDLYNHQGNSSHETWYRKDLKTVYEESVGDAIENYNSKQRQKCRQKTVESYMNEVSLDKRGKRQTKKVNGKRVVDDKARHGKQLQYEVTVKVGNTERERDANGNTLYDATGHHVRSQYLPRDLQKQVYKRYCETFQEENPNFRLVNMEYHADEGFYNRKGVWEYSVDHTHITFVPFATGFKQGLEVQNSMNKALAQMGFTGSDAYHLWADKEQQRLEKILQEEYEIYCKQNPQFYTEHGNLDIIHPVADGSKQGGLSKEEYSDIQEMEEYKQELQTTVDELQVRRDEVKKDINDRSERFRNDIAKFKEIRADLQKREADVQKREEEASRMLQEASKTLQEASEEKKRYKHARESLERQIEENKQSIAIGKRHMAEESYERIHGEPTGRIRGESGRIFGG